MASRKKALLEEINRKVTKFTIDNIQNNEEKKYAKMEIIKKTLKSKILIHFLLNMMMNY